MNLGDTILYISAILATIVLLTLIYEQKKRDNRFDKHIKWLIRIFSTLLVLDFLLLSYYFVKSDFTINYVWQYSSNKYPLYYKLSGTLAGYQGAHLLWAALIGTGCLWLSEGEEGTSDFVKKSQIIVVFLVIYFSFLTLKDSPFQTIYKIFTDIPQGFVPTDGRGLNPLLIDPWIAFQPFTYIIGYAATTIPFAGAVVYLSRITDRKEEIKDDKIWVSISVFWLRIAWIFTTLSLALGGVWAYKSVSWGGIWAWSPVETAMFLPWMMLTVAIHAFEEHKKYKNKYNFIAPFLVASSFTFFMYSTMVTRSRILETKQPWVVGDLGRYSMVLTILTIAIPLIISIRKYQKIQANEEWGKQLKKYVNISTLLLIFSGIIFLLFFGVTYPPILWILTPNSYLRTAELFNIWIYPFFILTMLVVGFILHYRPSNKSRTLYEFFFFSGLTILVSLVNTGVNFNIIDEGLIGSANPLVFRVIGSISTLTVVPPFIYIVYAVVKKFPERSPFYTPRNERMVNMIVLSLILIVLVNLIVVTSSFFGSSFSVTLNVNEVGKMTDISTNQFHRGSGIFKKSDGDQLDKISPYSVLLLDYKVEEHGEGQSDETGLEEYRPGLVSMSSKTVKSVRIYVFKNGQSIGEGFSKIEAFSNGYSKRPLISRSLLKDVSVIFDDVGTEDKIGRASCRERV